MRRSVDQAFLDLRAHITQWAKGGTKPGLRIFVYPPEWEAVMLARFPQFADECAHAGYPLHVVDVGQGFRHEIERRTGFIDQLSALERQRPERVLHDLGEIAQRYLRRLLVSPLEPPHAVRLLVNTGALGSFVSYSGVANALSDGGVGDGGQSLEAPTVIAFPGEGDDRSLSLLRLRADTNYRVPRI